MSYSRHLAKGLRILGERWFEGPRKWVLAGENAFDTAVRVALVAVAGYGVWRLVSSSWKVLALAVLVVIFKALRAATKAAESPAAAAPAKPPAADRQDLSEEDFLAFIWEVLDGAPAVHLATLAGRLTDADRASWTGDDIRALCKAHDIPIRPKVRDLGGDRVSSGVHRDDLDPLPQPLPEEAQEGPVGGYTAGGSGNATPLRAGNATATTRTTRRVGNLRIVAQDDPGNPARTHVTVYDPRRKRTC